jgi:undecaprenyl-diphosphatase
MMRTAFLEGTLAASDGYQWGPELAAILGLVEGLTEFLPVSSTGHLIIVGHLLGFTGAMADTVDVAIQLGSILAIIAFERRKIAMLLSEAVKEQAAFLQLLRTSGSRTAGGHHWGVILRRSLEEHRHLWFILGLGIAFLPAAVVGFVTHDWIERRLFTPQTVAVALIVGGFLILWVEATKRTPSIFHLDQVGLRTALSVGLAQCCALFPGVSRSGATIVGGLLAGMDRRVATEYSFFLALPTMILATVYQLSKSLPLFTLDDMGALSVGLVVSFLVGWAVIAGFLAFVKHHSLRSFAYYRIALGVIVLVMFS